MASPKSLRKMAQDIKSRMNGGATQNKYDVPNYQRASDGDNEVDDDEGFESARDDGTTHPVFQEMENTKPTQAISMSRQKYNTEAKHEALLHYSSGGDPLAKAEQKAVAMRASKKASILQSKRAGSLAKNGLASAEDRSGIDNEL